MSNLRTANVIIVDTTAAYAVEAVNIAFIKYIPGSGSPNVTIKADDSSGVTVWEPTAVATAEWNEVDIRLRNGMYVTVGGTGTKAYLYLK